MKNTVFIIAVKKDGQLKPEYEISIESWKKWCNKNDTQMFLLEEPLVPMDEMHIIWQRYFMFDIFPEFPNDPRPPFRTFEYIYIYIYIQRDIHVNAYIYVNK